MKRKLFILGMAMIMALSGTVMAFASEEENPFEQINIQEELNRAANGVSDVYLTTEQINEMVTAYIVDENDENMPLDVDVTVRMIPAARSSLGLDTYIMTAATKPIQGEANLYGVKAYGTLGWTDNLGTKNVLEWVDGGWKTDVTTGLVTGDRKVYYGVDRISRQSSR